MEFVYGIKLTAELALVLAMNFPRVPTLNFYVALISNVHILSLLTPSIETFSNKDGDADADSKEQ